MIGHDESTSATSAMEMDFAAAAKGDHGAFERLLQPAVPRLLAQVRRMAGGLSQADFGAEDLVQRVLEVAWLKLGDIEFRGARSFHAWIIQLARNVIRDRVKYLRAKGRSRAKATLGTHAEEIVAEMTSVPGRAAREERLGMLREALAMLPATHRNVVELHLLDGRTLGEIALAMSLSKNAVWERLQRGLLRLRDLLRG